MESETERQTLSIMTDAIGEKGILDPRYTCDLDNSSPELRWSNAPYSCKGFALIVEDVDAPGGIFTHWIIYNIPASIHHLPAGIPPQDSLPNGIRQGINSFGRLGYSGPCPPPGDKPHRYFFRLYALNDLPSLARRIGREDLLSAIQPFIVTKTEIVGKYQREIQRAG